MRSDDGRVDHHTLHIGFRGEMLEHRRPDSAFRPTIKTLVDGVPLTVLGWQKSPLRSAARHPENTRDEARAARQVLFCEQEMFTR